MYIGTHACLPLAIVSVIDIVRIQYRKDRLLNNIQYSLLALGGVLPDFLWPHFNMHQRLTSWTHTFWFLVIFFPVVYVLSKWLIKKNVLKFTIIFWMAALLHIFADAISGGVSFFYPFGKVMGSYVISHHSWITYDIILICLTVSLIFLRHVARKTRYQIN